MKHVFSVVLQTTLLLLIAVAGFLAGATVPALRVMRVVSHTAANVRTYDFDWLIAVALAYVLLLLIGVVRKRMPVSAVVSTAALLLTIGIVLLFTQLGVKDTPVISALLPAIPAV